MQKTKTIPRFNGIQTIHRFDNGYGASVIEHSISHGREMAVVKFIGPDIEDFVLCYDTPITNDVLGHLSTVDVDRHLADIAALSSSV